MSISDRELRERCFEAALRADPFRAAELAEQMLAFVTGESAKSPREIISAALDAANVR